MSAGHERPECWVEPVHESLLRPPSFFGAAPRAAVITVYVIALALGFVGAMNKSWLTAGASVVLAAILHLATASLTYVEPHWCELLREWLRSPQSRVEP